MDIYSIYKATNVVNGKSYIGFTEDFEYRYKQHHIKANGGSPYAFHRAIRKYGKESFVWEIIFQGTSKDDVLNWAEPHFISEFDSFSTNGYNMTAGGEGCVLYGEANGMFGRTHTDEVKLAQSQRKRGIWARTNNPNAKEYTFISPTGDKYIVKGNFKGFCNQNGLSHRKMKRSIDTGVILESTEMPCKTTEQSRNCVGWEVKRIS